MAALPSIDFQALPFRAQAAVVAGALALLAVGGYLGLAAPKSREIQRLKTQLTREEADSVSAVPANAPITEEERKLWAQLETRLRERFPEEKDLPMALEAVAGLARASGMEIVTVNLHTHTQPKPGSASGRPNPAGAATAPSVKVPPPLTLSPTEVRLTVLHRYRDLVHFLQGLDRLPVALMVESLEVKREKDRLRTQIHFRTLQWGAS